MVLKTPAADEVPFVATPHNGRPAGRSRGAVLSVRVLVAVQWVGRVEKMAVKSISGGRGRNGGAFTISGRRGARITAAGASRNGRLPDIARDPVPSLRRAVVGDE